jgi:hypothetical protein
MRLPGQAGGLEWSARGEIMRITIIACCLVLAISACSSTSHYNAEAIPASGVVQDPDDSMIDVAIQDYLKSSKGPLFSHYDYTRTDLDGDGRREALVLFSGPHSYWCDMNGCSLAVFKAEDNHFTLMSEMFPVRGPLYISSNKTDGWRNLIIPVTGLTYAKAKNVAMQFDGMTYPRNPIFEPGIQLSRADLEQKVFP